MSITRILLWSPKGAGLHYGGAGTNAFRMYSRLENQDVEITLAHAYCEQEHYPLFKEVVQIHDQLPLRFATRRAFINRANQWLIANASRFDVFHGLDLHPTTVYPASIAERMGLSAFVKPATHGSGFKPTGGWKRIFLQSYRNRRRARKVSGFVAISSAISRELESSGISRDRIHDIPNGVDSEKFRPVDSATKLSMRAEMGIGAEDLILLFVGALSERKHALGLLEGVAMLKDEIPTLKLIAVGPEREAGYADLLRMKAQEWGVESRLTIHEHQSEIARFYQIADVYGLLSSKEGMPNGLLEAMSCGLPAIATRISGSEDLVEHGVSGFFAHAADEVADSIKQLSDVSLRERMARVARKRILQKYDAKIVLDNYLELFSKR